jgi:hypothetical protein
MRPRWSTPPIGSAAWIAGAASRPAAKQAPGSALVEVHGKRGAPACIHRVRHT